MNLGGPELLILLVMFALPLVVVAVVIFAVLSSRRPPGALPPFPPSNPPISTRVDDLERLARLHAQGSLSDEEFQREKSRILGS